MLTRLFTSTLVAVAGVIAPSAPAGAHTDVVGTDRHAMIADYYGTKIDLSAGWGTAQACAISPTETVCFDTERELDDHLADTGGTERASCSSPVRLYAGTNFGLPVLTINDRLAWRNLASSGFDNRTRSYKVGACAAAFAKNSNGGGGFYPGSTGAGAESATMLSGWDRQISSVYLY